MTKIVWRNDQWINLPASERPTGLASFFIDPEPKRPAVTLARAIAAVAEKDIREAVCGAISYRRLLDSGVFHEIKRASA